MLPDGLIDAPGFISSKPTPGIPLKHRFGSAECSAWRCKKLFPQDFLAR
jgi:hypothetical protein